MKKIGEEIVITIFASGILLAAGIACVGLVLLWMF